MNLFRFIIGLLLMVLCHTAVVSAEENRRFPPGTREIYITGQAGVRSEMLANIAPLVEKSIAEGYYAGAVVLAAHRGHIIYRGVFGNQQITPEVVPMRFETIFDLASLTKVVVTTTAIMQLLESGRLGLDTPVAEYWPAFANNGKGDITIRELLTHTSGLPALMPNWTVPEDPEQRYAESVRQIEQIKPVNPPAKAFVYGDINFMVLGHLVELISGERLNEYAQAHILKSLNMKSTTFLPPSSWQSRIAPTYAPDVQQRRWGEVNDPATWRMGGVSGIAGLFGDAHDLGLFLQCLLNNGKISDHRYLLGPLTILKMSTPQTPIGIWETRGLGWDIDSPYSNRGVLLPTASYGHAGWTGVSVWLDPVTQTWIIILTSRTHPVPTEKNQVVPDRRAIANIIAGSLTDITVTDLKTTGAGELQHMYSKR
jgi:serine-type D-Ala-D-Ala carboxypeptidase